MESKRKNIQRQMMGGTLITNVDQPQEKLTVNLYQYDVDSCEKKVLNEPSFLENLDNDFEGVRWIEFIGKPEGSWIEALQTHIGVHPTVVEDILKAEQRPKFEEFDEHIFLVMNMFSRSDRSDMMFVQQLSLVLGENYVLTFQEHPNELFNDVINRVEKGKGIIRKMGSDYLVYRIIDAVVESYFSLIERVGESMEEIEDQLVEEPDQKVLYDVHSLKRDMIYFRKSIWPLREVVRSLNNDRTSLVNRSTEVYFRDIYDHTVQIIETVETYRDMLSGMLDLYLSSVSNKMNEVMKVLTIIATIFIPLTFIAGIYGMNFDPDASPLNMPELEWVYGYPIALLVMATIAGIMLIFFRRKGWL